MTDWQRIVSQHSGIIWQTAYRLLGDYEDAADCYQETFLKALEFSRRQKIKNWPGLLKRICTWQSLDRLRSRVRSKDTNCGLEDLKAVPSPNSGPIQEVQAKELSDKLRLALAKLPDKQAEAFCLRFFEDMSYREIAKLLKIKTSAVGVLLHRAREQLKELLLDTGLVEDAEVRS